MDILKKTFQLSVAILIFLSLGNISADDPDPTILETLSKSVVQIRYYLKYDNGQKPFMTNTCPGCPGFQGAELSLVIKENRPLIIPGYLISDNLVVSVNPMMSKEFIRRITIFYEDEEIDAKIKEYAVHQPAVFLEFTPSTLNAIPLAFSQSDTKPDLNIVHSFEDGTLIMDMVPMGTGISYLGETKTYFKTVVPASIITDIKGIPISMSFTGEIDLEGRWRKKPIHWKKINQLQMDGFLNEIKKVTDKTILRVKLGFRPYQKSILENLYSYKKSEIIETELNCTGVLLEENKLLVVADLKPMETARLERIECFGNDDEVIEADFIASISEFGAFIAEINSPVKEWIKFSKTSMFDFRDKLLLAARIKISEEEKTVHFLDSRITGYEIGENNNIHLATESYENEIYLFDLTGELVSLPLSYRKKLKMGSGYNQNQNHIIAVEILKKSLFNLESYSDKNNIPIPENESDRLAWIGLELQPLTKELAQANKILNITENGQTGALVTYVYPNSPAQKAGIEPGFILLGFYKENSEEPIILKLPVDRYENNFPWDKMDQIPEQYFTRIPTPWPSKENEFNRLLTNFGFGNHFKAQFYQSGTSILKTFKVQKAPRHFEIAEQFRSQGLGLTVSSLTYEVSRYFQKEENEPGVIIAAIEPGSKSSVAGLKPYEIITHVNDHEIADISEFEKYVSMEKKLRFSVKRMAMSRVVKIGL